MEIVTTVTECMTKTGSKYDFMITKEISPSDLVIHVSVQNSDKTKDWVELAFQRQIQKQAQTGGRQM